MNRLMRVTGEGSTIDGLDPEIDGGLERDEGCQFDARANDR